jgi:hypothetical protein
MLQAVVWWASWMGKKRLIAYSVIILPDRDLKMPEQYYLKFLKFT